MKTSKYTKPKLMGERTLGPARCLLRVPQIRDIPPNLREVAELEVPSAEQRKGYGTTLMHSVCREADKHGFVLMLAPQPFGDHIAMSRADLAMWYRMEFGFQAIQEEPLIMARAPGTTPARKLTLKPLDASLYKATKEQKHG
jgi:GNAT superfamily N-acetyltransferase